jgi:phosphoglycerate dehydrogenase-like enzyme
MPKVIVFATSFLDELVTHPPGEGRAKKMLLDAAARHGIAVDFCCDRDPSEPMTIEELEGAVAVIADLEEYDASLLSRVGPAAGGSLRLIARYGIGCNSIDIQAAVTAGILVSNTPGANALPTAEWTLATIIDVAGRRIHHHKGAAQGHLKSGPSRLDISGKTLGVVGMGHVGTRVVSLFKGFDMRIISHDRSPDFEWFKRHGVEPVDLPTVCREADFITLHTSGGIQIIGAAELALMKPTAVLVNCARRVHVDNRLVYEAVRDGRIWGYGIDEVWTCEDLPLDGLNIIASPHVGSDTDIGKVNMQLGSTRSVVDFLEGRPQKHPVTGV